MIIISWARTTLLDKFWLIENYNPWKIKFSSSSSLASSCTVNLQWSKCPLLVSPSGWTLPLLTHQPVLCQQLHRLPAVVCQQFPGSLTCPPKDTGEFLEAVPSEPWGSSWWSGCHGDWWTSCTARGRRKRTWTWQQRYCATVTWQQRYCATVTGNKYIAPL